MTPGEREGGTTKRNKSLLHLVSFPTRGRWRGRRRRRVQRRGCLLPLHLFVLHVNELVAQRLGRAHAVAASLGAVARGEALESVAAGPGGGRRLHRGGFERVVGGGRHGSIHDVVVGVGAVALFLQEAIDVLDAADVARPGPLVLLLLLLRVLGEREEGGG